MAIISPKQVIPGSEIKASDINDPINTIADLVNGNLDGANIKDGSIIASKIPDGSIPANKLTSNQTSYSTTEQDSGEKWIDGKIIYCKTVNLGAFPNSTTKNVAHGVTGMTYLVKYEGMGANSAPTFTALPFVNNGAASNWNMVVRVDRTNVIMVSDADNSSYSGYITLYYTK
jgi:hypothetical protein